MTFPNEQCKIKMACSLIVSILLCSLSSFNIGNTSVLAVNLPKVGDEGRGTWCCLMGRILLLPQKSCGQSLLCEKARGAPSRVGCLGKAPYSGKQIGTKNQSLAGGLGCASFIPKDHHGFVSIVSNPEAASTSPSFPSFWMMKSYHLLRPRVVQELAEDHMASCEGTGNQTQHYLIPKNRCYLKKYLKL